MVWRSGVQDRVPIHRFGFRQLEVPPVFDEGLCGFAEQAGFLIDMFDRAFSVLHQTALARDVRQAKDVTNLVVDDLYRPLGSHTFTLLFADLAAQSEARDDCAFAAHLSQAKDSPVFGVFLQAVYFSSIRSQSEPGP